MTEQRKLRLVRNKTETVKQAEDKEPARSAEFHLSTAPEALTSDTKGIAGMIVSSFYSLTKLRMVGMPRLRSVEKDVICFLADRGRRGSEGLISWAAARGGQRTIRASLAHELGVDATGASRAVKGLIEIGVVGRGVVNDHEAICLTPRIFDWVSEIRWRGDLRDAHPRGVAKIVGTIGWDEMTKRVDEVFRHSRTLRLWIKDDRRFAVNKVIEALDKG